MGMNARWQWLHRSGFKDYDTVRNAELEWAYASGDATTRIKSGKQGSIPMMIFFNDMLQFDPISGNAREIRRLGRDTWLDKAQRFCSRYYMQFMTGRSRRANLALYEKERARWSVATGRHQSAEPHAGKMNRALSAVDEASESKPLRSRHRPKCLVAQCRALCEQRWFQLIFALAVLVNISWVIHQVSEEKLDPDFAYQASNVSLEIFFMLIFSVELAIHFLAMEDWREDALAPDFLVRSTTLVSMLAENAFKLLDLFENDSKTLEVARSVCKMARLSRIARLFVFVRLFPQILTVLHGVAAALQSILATLILLVSLTSIFGIYFATMEGIDSGLQTLRTDALFLHASDNPVYNFETVGDAMLSLTLSGLFLDDIGTLVNSMNWAGVHPVNVAVFMLYTFLGAFTLFNMLIGFQCNVATRVLQEDDYQRQMAFLRVNMLKLLAAYDTENDGCLDSSELNLMFTDPELYVLLEALGTSVDNVCAAANILFEEMAAIPFSDLCDMIMALRESDPAKVMHIIGMRQYIGGRLQQLEYGFAAQLARDAGQLRAPSPSDQWIAATNGQVDASTQLGDERIIVAHQL